MLGKDPKTRAKADELLKEVVRAFDRTEGIPFFTTVTFEFGGRASLSWYLTSQEREEIVKRAREDERVNDRVRLLVRWWDQQPRNLDAEN